jgi:hypothetical protein
VSPYRREFDEPIVRVPFDRVRFPKECPICGAPASHNAKIIASPNRMDNPRYRAGPITPRVMSRNARILWVHVCDEHHGSDEGLGRLKLSCTLCDGLLIAMFFVAIMSLGADYVYQRPSGSLPFLVFGAIIVAAVISFFAFRIGPLENSIRIVGFDHAFQNIWLQFKRSEYRDAFIQENSMYAELVDWVLIA